MMLFCRQVCAVIFTARSFYPRELTRFLREMYFVLNGSQQAKSNVGLKLNANSGVSRAIIRYKT